VVVDRETEARNAVSRWLKAVNPPVDLAVVDEAVSADVYVTRYHWAGKDEEAAVVERFDGVEALVVWLRRTPVVLRFSLDGEPHLDRDAWVQAYAVEVEGEAFRGGGVWRYELDGDGKIRRLQHRPNPL